MTDYRPRLSMASDKFTHYTYILLIMVHYAIIIILYYVYVENSFG